MVKSLWDYRSFVWGGIRRDLQLRYFGSVLGIAWLVIQPAGLIAVYFLIFTTVFPNRTLGNVGNYGAFLCAGLIPWLMFSEIIQRGRLHQIAHSALNAGVVAPRVRARAFEEYAMGTDTAARAFLP